MNLAVELAPHNKHGLLLKNPVMAASGTFGYGVELAGVVDLSRLGAIICKGTTLLPRQGNPSPRLVETPAGLLNSIGLQNPGVRAIVRDKAPIWATWSVPVVVNIAGKSADEFSEIAGRLDGVPGVAGIEVNISCPNVAGGLDFGIDPRMAAEVTAAVRHATSLPVMVKLTPNVTDIRPIADAVVGAGADCISLINTVVGMAIDIPRRRPALPMVVGGLSGPAIKPLALRLVVQVAQVVDVPVVGIGGIASTEDALEFLMAGATAVQVGTAHFANPNASVEIADGLQRFLEREGVDDIHEVIGVAIPGRPTLARTGESHERTS